MPATAVLICWLNHFAETDVGTFVLYNDGNNSLDDFASHKWFSEK